MRLGLGLGLEGLHVPGIVIPGMSCDETHTPLSITQQSLPSSPSS